VLDLVRQILFLCLAFVIQTTWAHHLVIFEVFPDAVILTVVFIALRAGPVRSTLLAFCAGFVQDTYLPGELGLNALAKSVTAFAVASLRGRVLADSPRVQVMIICAAVLVHDLIFYAAHGGVAVLEKPYFWLRYAPGRALFTGLAAGLVVFPLRVLRRIPPVRSR
jgi:rod shape-determining protein MreD